MMQNHVQLIKDSYLLISSKKKTNTKWRIFKNIYLNLMLIFLVLLLIVPEMLDHFPRGLLNI